MKKVTWPVLETLDKNLDGYIDIEEFEALMNLHELLEKLEGVGVETGNMKTTKDGEKKTGMMRKAAKKRNPWNHRISATAKPKVQPAVT